MWEYLYHVGTALSVIHLVDCSRLWSISLHGLDQGREGNAWKALGSLLRFLFIEWLTLGAGAALEGAGSAGSWELQGSAAGYPGVA